VNWTRRHTLAAGLGLIALTNAVALVGAAWNRSGEEARLRLTQRELQRPYLRSSDRENSGISLALRWGVLTDDVDGSLDSSYGQGGEPFWLDRAKMQALGFDVSQAVDTERGRARYEKQLPREALLVLELDGPARQRVLELDRYALARAEAKLAARPGDKSLQQGVKSANEALEHETNGASRLFVVDAELDAKALRAKYPDIARYAIVRGEVRPTSVWRKPWQFRGYVSDLSIPAINVPFRFRRVFADAPREYAPDERKPVPFEAVVAFGKRLEPWIVEAAKK
jgi:hypothetical protein